MNIKNMNIKKRLKTLSLLAIALPFLISGCGKKEEPVVVPAVVPLTVSAVSASSSQTLTRSLSYPGIISSENEANIIAKIGGTVKEFKVKAGDSVQIGDELVKIDDVNGSDNGSGWSASQIKQAKIGVEQAQASYQLSRTNYDNLLVSTAKDLSQAEISKNQAATSQSNLDITTSEAYKSAELSYETAKLATEQAKLSLDNRKKQAAQGAGDAEVNAGTAADAAIAGSAAIISGLNNIAALDGATLSYKDNLGVLDMSVYPAAKEAYRIALDNYNSVTKTQYSNSLDKVTAAVNLVEKSKKLADACKLLFDKTVSSSILPVSSAGGASLGGLQSSASAYQSQASGLLGQANAAKQSLANVELGNSSSLDSLQKAYELAKQQEVSASQALSNLRAGNQAQKDQAASALAMANNQYENTRIKLDTQLQSAKMQLETAKLQLDNAINSLQSLYDNHLLVAPISGSLTKKLVNEGETVNAGQLLAVVGQTEKLKIQFYVDSDNLASIKPGQEVNIKDNQEHEGKAIINSVSLQPDASTKRFLAEAFIAEKAEHWQLGKVVDVIISVTELSDAANHYFMPLSAVEIGQNSSSIYTVSGTKAQRLEVKVIRVEGETALIEATLNPDTLLIIKGSKLLSEGQEISLSTNQ
jgi:multidrug efflux pump subunit AcrA (membrane-fusion protein)